MRSGHCRAAVFGIALGYEILNDHDELRHDPLMAAFGQAFGPGARTAHRWPQVDAEPAGNCSQSEPSRYHKIAYDTRR